MHKEEKVKAAGKADVRGAGCLKKPGSTNVATAGKSHFQRTREQTQDRLARNDSKGISHRPDFPLLTRLYNESLTALIVLILIPGCPVFI